MGPGGRSEHPKTVRPVRRLGGKTPSSATSMEANARWSAVSVEPSRIDPRMSTRFNN
jgi:hypothetical protein